MALRLGTLLFAIFFFVAFIASSFIHYSNKWKKKYSIRNMFPYEVNYNANFTDNGWGNSCLIAMTFSLLAFFLLFANDFDVSIFLPVKIAGAIAAVVIPFVVLVPLKLLRGHIAVIIAQFFTSACLPATIAITALRTYQAYSMTALPVVVLIIASILVILILGLIFNPGLSLRIKYERSVNEKGDEVISRPKTIVMALAEWLLIFSVLISAILLFVLMFAF